MPRSGIVTPQKYDFLTVDLAILLLISFPAVFPAVPVLPVELITPELDLFHLIIVECTNCRLCMVWKRKIQHA